MFIAAKEIRWARRRIFLLQLSYWQQNLPFGYYPRPHRTCPVALLVVQKRTILSLGRAASQSEHNSLISNSPHLATATVTQFPQAANDLRLGVLGAQSLATIDDARVQSKSFWEAWKLELCVFFSPNEKLVVLLRGGLGRLGPGSTSRFHSKKLRFHQVLHKGSTEQNMWELLRILYIHQHTHMLILYEPPQLFCPTCFQEKETANLEARRPLVISLRPKDLAKLSAMEKLVAESGRPLRQCFQLWRRAWSQRLQRRWRRSLLWVGTQ